MSDSRSNWTFGQIENFELEDDSYNENNKAIYDNETDTEYKFICFMYNINILDGIRLYKRKAITLMDYLANIAALGTSVFNLLTKIFGTLYSKNFVIIKLLKIYYQKKLKR